MRRFSSVPSGHVVRAVAQPAMVATAMYTDGAANADRIFTIVPARVALRDPRRIDMRLSPESTKKRREQTQRIERQPSIWRTMTTVRRTFARVVAATSFWILVVGCTGKVGVTVNAGNGGGAGDVGGVGAGGVGSGIGGNGVAGSGVAGGFGGSV